MPTFFPELDAKLQAFIKKQLVFFVATAPTSGRVNLSPKGLDSLRILDARTIGYLDLTGSGNETAAHISENGRLTMMLTSFDETPLILRMYGTGEVIGEASERWAEIASHFTMIPGVRQIIVLHIESVQTSCGWGVPIATELHERPRLEAWAVAKGDDGIRAYQRSKNAVSIDGIKTSFYSPDAPIHFSTDDDE